MSKFKKRHANQIWWERLNGIQPLGDMAFDHVITWYIKNIISQQRLQTWLEHNENKIVPLLYVMRFITCHLLYSYMSFIAQLSRKL